MGDDFCEGCGVRDLGDNFSHPGLCKRCNDKIQGMQPEELLSTKDVGVRLAASSQTKDGSFKTWGDTGSEVEIRVPLPVDTTSSEVRVDLDVSAKRLRVRRVTGGGEQTLLLVEPLFDRVKGGDDLVWFVERCKKPEPDLLMITLEKTHPAPWGQTLCKEGGTLACWSDAG